MCKGRTVGLGAGPNLGQGKRGSCPGPCFSEGPRAHRNFLITTKLVIISQQEAKLCEKHRIRKHLVS